MLIRVSLVGASVRVHGAGEVLRRPENRKAESRIGAEQWFISIERGDYGTLASALGV